MRRIPNNKTWSGIYSGENYGDLWATFNVDLDRKDGVIGLSRRMFLTSDSNDTALAPVYNGSIIQGFLRTDADCTDRYWAISYTDLLKTDSASIVTLSVSNDWDTDGLDSSPNNSLSFAVFGKDSRADSGRDKLFVTNDTDISVLNDTGDNKWTGGWWTVKQSQPPLDSNDSYHSLTYLPFIKRGLVGDGNKIHTIYKITDTQNDTIAYARLILPSGMKVRHMFPTSSRAWILAENTAGGHGAVIEWDGFSQTYNAVHDIKHHIPVAGVSYQGIPIVLNGRGQFFEFDGQSFSPMIRNGIEVKFPSEDFDSPIARFSDSNYTVQSAVAPRGMTVGSDGLIYLNVGSPDFAPSNPRRRSGIWCLNPYTGKLYNKHSLSVSDSSTDSQDFGQQANLNPGAILWTDEDNAPIVAGGEVYGVNESSRRGIWRIENSMTETQRFGKGYFVTQWMYSDAVMDFWDQLWVRFKRFISSSDRIVVKARGTRPLVDRYGKPLDATISWVNSTTFEVTLNSADDPIAVGDEVMVLRSGNAGNTAHITSITGAHAAVQTVVLDETFAAASSTGNALAHFDRWKKIGTISDANTYHKMMNIGIDSSFIQFKVEMRGYYKEMEIHDLTVKSTPSLNL